MAFTEFGFTSIKAAGHSLQIMIDKIERVGYFSIKDAATMRFGIRPRLRNGYPVELPDFDHSEFFGWTDIKDVTIEYKSPKTSDPTLPAESDTCVLYLPYPIYIGHKIEEHIKRYLNTKEENDNE